MQKVGVNTMMKGTKLLQTRKRKRNAKWERWNIPEEAIFPFSCVCVFFFFPCGAQSYLVEMPIKCLFYCEFWHLYIYVTSPANYKQVLDEVFTAA